MGQIDVRFYIWMFFRRLPFIVLMTVLGVIAGVLVALSLKPTYKAVAKILVESPRISSDLARSEVPADAFDQLQILEQRLTTRDSILSMARSLDIYPDISTMSESQITGDMRSRTAFEPVVFNTLRSGKGALLFAVSFEADNPVLASRVANWYATTILEGNATLRKERASDALEFISQDVDRLDKVLNEAEASVASFTTDHRDALPDSLEFRRAQQASQQERLLQIQREEESLRSRRLTLKQIYAHSGVTGVPGMTTPEDQLIGDLRRTLAEQLAIFAETSPNIMVLRQRIQALEAEAQSRRADATQEQDKNPSEFPAELQIQLADIDNQLKVLATEKDGLKQSLAEIDQTITATVENETVLKRLQRDYETAQSQYNNAQGRLAEASTAARIEQESIGGKLTLIEPAIPPETPFGPRRRYVAAGGAVLGFFLSMAIIVLIEFWRGAIYRPAEIARIFDGEPLVAVPYIHSPGEPARSKLIAGLLPALALLCVLGGGPCPDFTATAGNCTPYSSLCSGSGLL